MAGDILPITIYVDGESMYETLNYMSSSSTTIHSIITNDAGLSLSNYSSDIYAIFGKGSEKISITDTTTVNDVYMAGGGFGAGAIDVYLTTSTPPISQVFVDGKTYDLGGGIASTTVTTIVTTTALPSSPDTNTLYFITA